MILVPWRAVTVSEFYKYFDNILMFFLFFHMSIECMLIFSKWAFISFPPVWFGCNQELENVSVFMVEHTTKGKSWDVASLLVFQRPFASEMNVTEKVDLFPQSKIMLRKYSYSIH